MEEQAVITLLSCHDVEEKNNEKLKAISAQKKQALDAIKQKMIEQRKTCVPVNDKYYVVLENHDVKPKLTPETVGILLQGFLAERNIIWTQTDIDAFVKFIDLQLTQNATKVQSCKLTDKKPLRMMINKV